jgi:hypothetical protein
MAVAEKNWPTTAARDYKGTSPGYLYRKDGKSRADQLSVAVDLEEQSNLGKLSEMQQHGLPAPANPSTDGSRQGLWATPNTMDSLPSRSYEAMKRQATTGGRKNRSRPGNLREQIDPLMCQAYKDAQAEANNWPTPTAISRVRNEETMEKCLKFRQSNGQTSVPLYLEEKVVKSNQWATPNAFDWNQPETMEQWKKRAAVQAEKGVNLHMPLKSQVTPVSLSAKLNQRWVETLMGIPMGWTSPSCPASVIRNWPKFMSGWLKETTAQTSCDPVAMELFQQQQNEHSES